jgi:tRNA-2-methylthio-N6-dimethylallyladenosine synthase
LKILRTTILKYYIKTFGCQLNISDSERIAGFLEMHKVKPAKDMNQADLVIFNTCGVRQSAEDRVYGQIHNLRKSYPKITIILTGCLSNRKDVQRRLKNKVDLFCEIKDFSKKLAVLLACPPELASGSLSCHSRESGNPVWIPDQVRNDNISYLSIQPKYATRFTAYIPIMTGCNNFCSYCVVPYARGPEVSRPAEDIIKEVHELVKNGCKEIILLGQNVNSYQFIEKNSSAEEADRKFKITNFPQLLKKVNAISGNFWISFISNHPKDFSDELIDSSTKFKKVCELVHLPIQAGNDKILKIMNRKYTAKQYIALVDKIKKAFKKHKPGKLYAITSDIIVGFPGETKKQFLESAKIMGQVSYDMVYFGQFSPRPGTAAYNLKNNVSKKEKERRENYLNEILKKTASKNNRKYLGKTIGVLITNKKGQYYFGHSRTMKNVRVVSQDKNLLGKIIKVKITKTNTWNLEGKK